MDLKNSTILITGGTRGIRLGLVKQLSALQATVVVTGRNEQALNDTKKLFPASTFVCTNFTIMQQTRP